jgi:hypothetical protein
VERPGPATSNGRGEARNRLLARLPKPELVSNRKVLSEHRRFLADHVRFRRKETCERRTGRPVLDRQRPPAIQLFAARLLFDYFVCAQQDRLRHRQAERHRGLGVQSHLEFDR